MNESNRVRWNLWKRFVTSGDPAYLPEMLSPDIKFSSPFYWKPQPGIDYATILLSQIVQVFEGFEYRRTWMDGDNWALEFHARALDMEVKGIDLMTWNHDHQLSEFEVMVRPMNALAALGEEMKKRITAQLEMH
jgi:hypothetical protein